MSQRVYRAGYAAPFETGPGMRPGRPTGRVSVLRDAAPIPSGPLAQAAQSARERANTPTTMQKIKTTVRPATVTGIPTALFPKVRTLAETFGAPITSATYGPQHSPYFGIRLTTDRKNDTPDTYWSGLDSATDAYESYAIEEGTRAYSAATANERETLALVARMYAERIIEKPVFDHLAVTLDDVDEAYAVALGFSARNHALNAVKKDARTGVLGTNPDHAYITLYEEAPLDAVLASAKRRNFGS